MPPVGTDAPLPHPSPGPVRVGAFPPPPSPGPVAAEGVLPRPHPALVAATVLPHPPLLVAGLAGGAAAELDPLRAACRRGLSAVLGAADLTVVVGGGPAWAVPGPSAPGSFRAYGADVQVTLPAQVDLDLPGLPAPSRLDELPLSLAVAAHLLAGVDAPPSRVFAATVPPSLGPDAAAAIGHALTGVGPAGGRVGLVTMGDLSACRTERAPGAFRPEAVGFDASVAEAFRAGKPERLLDLDPTQAGELLVAGRVPLQVLAGACDRGPPMRGQVLYDDAPYGVGYLVALLTAP